MPDWRAWLPALSCLLIALLPVDWQAALAWQREALAEGQLWRLWSGHLVHHGGWHALASGLSLWAAAAALPRAARVIWLPILAAAMPAISVALWFAEPDMGEYRGASALVMLGLAWMLLTDAACGNRLAVVALLVIALAVSLEASGVALPLSSLPQGVTVAWQAHLAGFLLAVVVAVGNRWRQRPT